MKHPHFGETKPIEVQDKEETCIRRVCKHFGWACDVAPNPLAFNYEAIKLRPREYIALGDECTTIRCLSPSRGEGHSLWLVFEDFLDWLNAVEWFSSTDWLKHLNDHGYYPWLVSNPFFGRGLKTTEEIEIFLDLLEAATSVDSKHEWKQEDSKEPKKSQ